jgi:hypothetical protein
MPTSFNPLLVFQGFLPLYSQGHTSSAGFQTRRRVWLSAVGISWELKRPNPLGLKCDTITSPRRLVNTFIHQMITDLLKRDKPIKAAINFKSWSTTRDISSEWG